LKLSRFIVRAASQKHIKRLAMIKKVLEHGPTNAEQWGWRCGFHSGSRRGARAEGTAADFDQARSQF
jgi:hypothetical protein